MRVPIRLTTLVASLLLFSGCYSAGRHPIVNARSQGGLAYDLVGEGPLIVLIHGTNLDRRMWDEELKWLGVRARVLNFDLRGQGASDFPTKPYSNHGDLLELLEEIEASEVVLLGLSAGVQVALDAALEEPDRFTGLILVSPSMAGYMPKEMPPYLADLMAALRAKDFKRANELLLASSIMSVPPGREDRVRTIVEENERLWTIP